jgi:hypothetical protein
MGRPDVPHPEMHAAEFEVGIAGQPQIGFREALRLVVDPGAENILALLVAQPGRFRADYATAGFVRPDFRAKILENLDAVVVIGMVMADDDPLDRLFGCARIAFTMACANEGEPRVSNTTTPAGVMTNPALDMNPSLRVLAAPASPGM